MRQACALALKEDDHACYARCPASECLQVLSQADVRLAGLSPADIIGLPEGLHMIPSFVRPKVDQDACHSLLLLCRDKTVGRDASAALLSKSSKGVGPHVKCRRGRHFCYTCNGDLSENKSTCTLCLPKQSQTQAAVAAPAATTAAPGFTPRTLVDDVRQHVP